MALQASKIAAASAALIFAVEIERKKRKKIRSCWIKNWKARRGERSSFQLLQKELLLEDKDAYRNYLRMDEDTFLQLLGFIELYITKEDSSMRKAISAGEKLAATFRFLATGESYQSLEYQTRLSKSFLSINVPQVCDAIYATLKGEYLKFPETSEEWLRIAENYFARWQYPLCLGALDGKHVTFRALREDGAFYRNYKGTDSIVLFALVDADYKFIYTDIGCNGRISDGGILRQSKLMTVIENAEIHFPPNKVIGNNRNLPHVIIGDDAFPLQEHIMKPYPFRSKEEYKRIFNYRLSRARRSVEHAFGILANRFRVLLSAMDLNVSNVQSVVQACCILHNFLLEKNKKYSELTEEDNLNRDLLGGLSNNMPSRYSRSAGDIRETFAQYFTNEGKVSWQDEQIQRNA